MKMCLQNQSNKSADSKKRPEILREYSTASWPLFALQTRHLTLQQMKRLYKSYLSAILDSNVFINKRRMSLLWCYHSCFVFEGAGFKYCSGGPLP